jgi:hypothetical protein
MTVRMVHAALAGCRAINEAWTLDDVRDSMVLLTNILQSTHHLVMASLGSGVVDLQKQYSKYVVGPTAKEEDDSTTAIDDDYKKRTMVDFFLLYGRFGLGVLSLISFVSSGTLGLRLVLRRYSLGCQW